MRCDGARCVGGRCRRLGQRCSPLACKRQTHGPTRLAVRWPHGQDQRARVLSGRHLLAVGDTYKEVRLWDRASGETKVEDFWVYHQAKVTSLAWTPDSKFLASGFVDSHIYLWNPEKQMKKTKLAFAHTGGVNCSRGAMARRYFRAASICIRRWNAPKLPA